MSETSKRSPVDGQPSSKQWEQIKEKLKSAWHRKDPASFDKEGYFRSVFGVASVDLQGSCAPLQAMITLFLISSSTLACDACPGSLD